MARIRGKKSATADIQEYIIDVWGGLNTAVKNIRELEAGYASRSVNWMTGWDPIKKKADRIELRRGSTNLGITDQGAGKVTGLGVGTKYDGTEVPFFSYARKLMYWDSVTQDYAEISSNILPATASGEDVDFHPYTNLAGAFIYACSPNSDFYKIPVANPGSAVAQSASQRGRFNIYKNASYLWQKIPSSSVSTTALRDNTGLSRSYIDANLLTHYTSIGNDYMSLPGKPSGVVSLTGGNIADGTYYYVVTAFGPSGVETTKSVESDAIVVAGGGGNAKITLTWTAPAGANGYNVFRTTVSGTYTTPALVSASILGTLTVPTLVDTLASPTTGAPAGTTTQPLIPAIGTGDGSTKTFSGTLSNISGAFTAFIVNITDGIENFTDTKNGTFQGSLSGTGTINYATGAYSVTFNTAPASGVPITASYYREDATVGGILDYTYSATRTIGQGEYYPQFDGSGILQNTLPYAGQTYQFHNRSVWSLLLSQGDLTNTNNPFRDTMGIPYHRAAFADADGISFLDNTNPAQPRVKLLSIPATSTTTLPSDLSDVLDLSPYTLTSAVVYRWGDYRIVSLQGTKTYNDTTFVQNVNSKYWDQLDYRITCCAEYNGTLLGGDSISNNVYVLFSGFDDDGQVISNVWESGEMDLTLDGQKKVKRMVIEGLIQPNQSFDINLGYDGGTPVNVFTVQGDGVYVSKGTPTTVGNYTLGSKVVGSTDQVSAYPYRVDFLIATDKFEFIKVQLVAQGIGYVSVNRMVFKDIRNKGHHLIPTQTVG
jgi:hypothetical protein